MSVTEFQELGEVEMDQRGRVSLGRLHVKGPARFLVERSSHGEIRMIPVISIPVRSATPWTTKEQFEASLDKALEQVERGETLSEDAVNALLDEDDDTDPN